MIVIPSRENGEGPLQFQFRHSTYLVCSNRVGEILHFVQDDNAVAAEGV